MLPRRAVEGFGSGRPSQAAFGVGLEGREDVDQAVVDDQAREVGGGSVARLAEGLLAIKGLLT